MTTNINKLIAIGGNEWNAGNHHRIYFNDLPEWFGLELSYYGTGNISLAKLNGEKVSNSQARKLVSALDIGKLFYDVNNGEWIAQRLDESLAETCIESIERKARETKAEAQKETIYCHRCDSPLDADKAVWLNHNSRTGLYEFLGCAACASPEALERQFPKELSGLEVPCMSHYPKFDHYCHKKANGCQLKGAK